MVLLLFYCCYSGCCHTQNDWLWSNPRRRHTHRPVALFDLVRVPRRRREEIRADERSIGSQIDAFRLLLGGPARR